MPEREFDSRRRIAGYRGGVLNALTAVARAGAPRVTAVPVTERESWERLFARVEFPHLTQAWCYGEGKRAQGWSVERLVFQDEDGPIALCQVLVRRFLGLPIIARVNRGPVFLHESSSREVHDRVYSALRRRWSFGRRGLLLIAPALPFDDASAALLRSAGFRQRRPGGWGSALIDLQRPLDAIRAGVASTWRNRLNASLKSGVEVRIRDDREAFDWMLEGHATNMAVKGFVGPEVRFLRAMIDADPNSFRVVQGLIDNVPSAGILVARFGAHAEPYLCWTGEAGRRANAHNLLYWTAISEMKIAGCRAVDLGGYTTTEKYGAFKRGMKGDEYRLCGEWLAF